MAINAAVGPFADGVLCNFLFSISDRGSGCGGGGVDITFFFLKTMSGFYSCVV